MQCNYNVSALTNLIFYTIIFLCVYVYNVFLILLNMQINSVFFKQKFINRRNRILIVEVLIDFMFFLTVV